jgi:hypothetical protein
MIKQSYLVTFDLPVPLPAAFIQGIPENRMVVDRLLRQQHFQFFAVAADRSQCWAVVMAESGEGVASILGELPLIDFMAYQIQELAILNIPEFTPSYSWN